MPLHINFHPNMGKKEALLDIVHSIGLYFMSMKPVGSTFRCEMSPITSSGHPLAREREVRTNIATLSAVTCLLLLPVEEI